VSNSITRRSFLKRSGGVTAATLVSWHLSSATVRAAQQNVHPCEARSDDKEWTGTGQNTRKLSTYKTALGQAIGNDIANEIITAFVNSTIGQIVTFRGGAGWQDTVRQGCIDAVTTWLGAQNQDLVWNFDGSAVERKRCAHLNSPSLTKSTGSMTLSMALNLKFADFGLGGTTTVVVDLVGEGSTYFNSSLSELVQIGAGGSAVVAQDGRLSASVSGGLTGILEVSVSGAGSVDTQDVAATVSP
jgi:hypothetical protein